MVYVQYQINTIYRRKDWCDLEVGWSRGGTLSLARLSPLIHEHINTQGRHSFVMPEAVVKGELRPLRNPADDPD